jgi:hypothetical protein
MNSLNCDFCDFYDSNDFIHVIATQHVIAPQQTQHVIASETKQTRINYECSGLVTFGAPFGGHSVRNDAVGFCNNVMGYPYTVQRCRDGACPVRTNKHEDGHDGDGARPVPTNGRWNRKNIIQYHINQINHSSEKKSKIK